MNDLVSLLWDYKIIATIGICKNAGKTTVLKYLIKAFAEKMTVGITSIGYDGENIDGVTALPKPRIVAKEGMMIATGESCLCNGAMTYEVLEETPYETIFGKVLIVRCLEEGLVEVSGPSIVTHLGDVCRRMQVLGCDKVIADGAAGRLSFGTQADGCILSVGAAYGTRMEKVVDVADYKVMLLQLPKTKLDAVLPEEMLYRRDMIEEKLYYFFRGVVSDEDVLAVMKENNMLKQVIVARDSASLFLSMKVYERFTHNGGSVEVLIPMNLVALTINPMSPYGPWFDPVEFEKRLKEKTGLPVFNVGE